MDRSKLLEVTKLGTASDYQVSIFSHIANQIDNYIARANRNRSVVVENLLVQAAAGSGKTTTIVAASRLIPSTYIARETTKRMFSLFLAFNKDIVTELKARLPENVQAKTLNSLGSGIWANYVKGLQNGRLDWKTFVDPYKVNRIMRDVMIRQQIEDYGDDVRFVVKTAKHLGIIPQDCPVNAVPANGLEDTDETWQMLSNHFDHPISPVDFPTVMNFAREVLRRNLKEETVVDFDDQKYFPVVRRTDDGSHFPAFKFDIIMIDEVQDVNAVDMALIRLVSKPNTLTVGVGDKRQAIYGFRGADVNAVSKFKSEFGCTELPLTITYRCGTKIVDYAREVWPEIEAAPNAHTGAVVRHDEYTAKLFNAGDMIICPQNAPTVNLAYKLIAARVPCIVKGRDIGANLLSLIKKLKAETVIDLASKMVEWRNQQIAVIREANEDDEDAVQRINDRYDTMNVFISNNSDNNLETLKADIEELFGVKKRGSEKDLFRGKVVLSSGHKSKGLEAQNVYILDHAELMYPRWLAEGTWRFEQQKNLDYVMRTRAKEHLGHIELKGYVS